MKIYILFGYDQNKGVIILKIFIAGPRAIKELDKNICVKLENICAKNYDVLVGDADGIDSCIQRFFEAKSYRKVTIFASKGIARNNYGDWKIETVNVANNITGFDFYAQKDLVMAKKADIGFMIWNGKSRGTFNNIVNLLKLEKNVILYYIPNQKFYQIKTIKDLNNFLSTNVKLDSKLKKILPERDNNQFVQACLF